MVLDKTKFLPDKQPKLPPGMLQCQRRVALRPKDTPCPECARVQWRAAAANGKATTTSLAGGTPSSSLGKSAQVLETIVEHVDGAFG